MAARDDHPTSPTRAHELDHHEPDHHEEGVTPGVVRPGLAHRVLPMRGRDPHEAGRASTPLELLFDLTVVVAIGVSAEQLAERIVEGHLGTGLLGFVFTTFAIFWAWLNFSWFASAFDTDDWLFRLLTMVQMVGVTVLALGIADVFHSLDEGHHLDNRVVVLGYVVMRLALVAQWLRVARQSPAHRRAALTYVRAVVVAQVVWVVIALLPLSVGPTLALVLVAYLVELAGPVVAERGGGTPWHAHHIAERYSLFAIIALGEGVVGTLAALTSVERADGLGTDVALLALAGIGLTVAMWWVYFMLPSAPVLHRHRERGFVWGYGHLVLFAGIIATGAGLHVAALALGEGHGGGEGDRVDPVTVVLSVAVPLLVYLLAVYALYGYLVRRFDALHLWLVAGTVGVLCAVVALVAGGWLPAQVALLLLVAAPAVTVVGYEVSGHRHAAAALAPLARPGDGGETTSRTPCGAP